MTLRHIPNIITIIRILLIVPFVYFFLTNDYRSAFYVFMVAGASDGLDGIIARHFNWTSRFGSFMDPIADKLLMMTSFSLLAWFEFIPLWLFVIVILRDVIIVSGVGGVIFIRGKADVEPSAISKLNTAFQVLLIGFLLFELSYSSLPVWFINLLMAIVVTTSVLSVFGYFLQGIKQTFFNDDDVR